MKINERLNLVVPLYDEADKVYAYVHSTPISYEVFKANYLLISKTYMSVFGNDLGPFAGPRVAALVMDEVAEKMTNGPQMVSALMTEVRRLSTVIMPNDNGWTPVPFEAAIKRGMLDQEDIQEVLSAITFFLVVWHLAPRSARADILSGTALIWGAQLSLLNATAYLNSLPISTGTENTGAMVVAS